MSDEENNPLDDDLLRELGLEPRQSQPPPAAKPPPKKAVMRPPLPLKQTEAPVLPPITEQTPMAEPEHSSPSVADADFKKNATQLALDIPTQLVAVLGKKNVTLKDVLDLKPGEIVELKKMPQEAIDLVANGKLVARGELVLVDGRLGIQIKQVV